MFSWYPGVRFQIATLVASPVISSRVRWSLWIWLANDAFGKRIPEQYPHIDFIYWAMKGLFHSWHQSWHYDVQIRDGADGNWVLCSALMGLKFSESMYHHWHLSNETWQELLWLDLELWEPWSSLDDFPFLLCNVDHTYPGHLFFYLNLTHENVCWLYFFYFSLKLDENVPCDLMHFCILSAVKMNHFGYSPSCFSKPVWLVWFPLTWTKKIHLRSKRMGNIWCCVPLKKIMWQ